MAWLINTWKVTMWDPLPGLPIWHRLGSAHSVPTWSPAPQEASVPSYLDPRFLLIHNNRVQGITLYIHVCMCMCVHWHILMTLCHNFIRMLKTAMKGFRNGVALSFRRRRDLFIISVTVKCYWLILFPVTSAGLISKYNQIVKHAITSIKKDMASVLR